MEVGRSYRNSKTSVIGAGNEWLPSAIHPLCEDQYSE